MTSNKQRHEVAANLRDEAEAWRTDNGDDTVYSMSDCTFTESVLTAFGFDDMEMDAYRIFEKMADLIDLPTCHDIGDFDHGTACRTLSTTTPISRIGTRSRRYHATARGAELRWPTMSKAKMTVYLVIDHGGEWEDSWSAPYMAFADEQAAKECVEKRTRRGFCRRRDETWCAWSDYTGSTVCAVDVLVDYFGTNEVSSDE